MGAGFNLTSGAAASNAFNVAGLQYYTAVWITSGSPTCAFTLDGAPIAGGSFSTGSLIASQNCGTSGSFTTSSAAFAAQAKMTPTVSGSGTVSLFIFGYVSNPAGTGGGPVTQSGTWTVQPGNTANTTPWLFAGAVTQSGTWTVQPGNTPNTTAWLARLNDGTSSMTSDFSAYGTAPTGTLAPGVNAFVTNNNVQPGTQVGVALTATPETALTTAVNLKASTANLYGFQVTNGAASVCYLQFINGTSPVLGTASTYSFAVPASGSLTVMPGTFALSNYATALSVGMSTTYNGSTACGTAATAVIFYK